MLLVELMKKVKNVEPGADINSDGMGHWTIYNPRKRNPTQTDQPLVLARVFIKMARWKGGAVTEVVHVKILGNTGPHKQLRVWMLLWGVPLK